MKSRQLTYLVKKSELSPLNGSAVGSCCFRHVLVSAVVVGIVYAPGKQSEKKLSPSVGLARQAKTLKTPGAAAMSSFFLRVPGAVLGDKDRVEFMAIVDLVDRATDELLLRPDIDRTVEIVDAINALSSKKMIDEVIFLFRHKIGSRSPPKTVFLALTLLASLAQNCGTKVHMAINSCEALLVDMMKVARKYTSRGGGDSAEVADVVLEIIQAWGEAFLPLSREYPHIVRTYHELRKEGLPFKAQYDSSRVPIFVSAESNGREYGNTPEDMLARTINNASISSGNGSSSDENYRHRGSSSFSDRKSPQNDKFNDMIEQVKSTLSILFDCADSKLSSIELVSDELVAEIVASLVECSKQTEALVGEALAQDSLFLGALLSHNDALMKSLHTFNEVANNKISLTTCKDIFQEIKKSIVATASSTTGPTIKSNLVVESDHESEFGTVVKPSFKSPRGTTEGDLLGLGLDSPVTRTQDLIEIDCGGGSAANIAAERSNISSANKKNTIPLLPPPRK